MKDRLRHTPKTSLTRRPKAELNLTDIFDMVQKQSGIRYATVKYAIRTAFDIIQHEINDGHSIEIPHFGVFGFKLFKERLIPNIANGNRMVYNPAHKVIKFTPDRAWAEWQKMHSMIVPGQLPPGCDYGVRIKRSKEGRRMTGIDFSISDTLYANESANSFYESIIVARAKRKLEKDEAN